VKERITNHRKTKCPKYQTFGSMFYNSFWA